MNKFFIIAMRGLAFVFLAAAIIVVFYYISLNKYEAEGLGGTTIAAVLSCISSPAHRGPAPPCWLTLRPMPLMSMRLLRSMMPTNTKLSELKSAKKIVRVKSNAYLCHREQ